jgi:hypothetical protein
MTTLPEINLQTKQLEELQREILLLDATSLGEKKNLLDVIVKSHNLLAEIITLAKKNKNLEYFLNNISNALLELYHTVQSDEKNPRQAKPREILQQLATTYQESMVPMLTRLHNLSQDSDDMLRITSIASLGNEIITCSSQLYQFSDNLDTHEKVHAMLGTLLMYAGIGLSITTLSGYAVDIQIFEALTCIALGCALARIAMDHYKDLPEADLARTALANIPAAIAKIDKDPQEQAYLHKILSGDVEDIVSLKASKALAKSSKTAQLSAEKQEKKLEAAAAAESKVMQELKTEIQPATESEPESKPNSQSLLQKMKSFMGFSK